ncbi:nicotinamide riboside transporter PnuC [Mucilaginibacter sp. UYCu711]|uniref:nicotinamide riboside transporter PnuC n=1 Tax=Mucilaginibacter sp. UYCu711 TaxID=3156339 RepID=UPI003D221D7C
MAILHTLQTWWQQQSLLEVIGVITGLLCVYLAAKNIIWNWPIAIISTAIYIYIYGKTGFYADMFQYIYLCITSMYGWYNWTHHPVTENTVPITKICKSQIIWSVIIVLVATPTLGYTLIRFASILHYNPPAYPYIDSFCTCCSFIAQYFLTRKIVENWLIWIFVDIIYTVIYFKKDLQITAGMFAILIIIAVFGYIDWKRDWKKQGV